jgi:hypothetical protein
MLGAGSSTAAVKAGSALNSALKQGGSQLAGRVQQEILRASQTKSPPRKISRTGKNLFPRNQDALRQALIVSQPGELIVSLQGAAPRSPRRSKPISTGQDESALKWSATDAKSDKISTEAGSQKYKSAITLSFPE